MAACTSIGRAAIAIAVFLDGGDGGPRLGAAVAGAARGPRGASSSSSAGGAAAGLELQGCRAARAVWPAGRAAGAGAGSACGLRRARVGRG